MPRVTLYVADKDRQTYERARQLRCGGCLVFSGQSMSKLVVELLAEWVEREESKRTKAVMITEALYKSIQESPAYARRMAKLEEAIAACVVREEL